MTTPPPFRKNAISQVNTSTSATATAAVVAAAAVAVLANTPPNDDDDQTFHSNSNGSNFIRSSSHDSHLRNRVEPIDASLLDKVKPKLTAKLSNAIESTSDHLGLSHHHHHHHHNNNQSNKNQSSNNSNVINKISSSLLPATVPHTPTSLASKHFYLSENANSINDVTLMNNTFEAEPSKASSASSLSHFNALSGSYLRKASIEGSENSSRGQSGQTSPTNMPTSPTRLDNNNNNNINRSTDDIDRKYPNL